MANSKIVSVSMPPDVAKRIDAAADRAKLSRSEYMVRACEALMSADQARTAVPVASASVGVDLDKLTSRDDQICAALTVLSVMIQRDAWGEVLQALEPETRPWQLPGGKPGEYDKLKRVLHNDVRQLANRKIAALRAALNERLGQDGKEPEIPQLPSWETVQAQTVVVTPTRPYKRRGQVPNNDGGQNA